MARIAYLSAIILLVAFLAIQLPVSTSAWFFRRKPATARPPSSIPSSCYSPSGADCSWYTDCLERKIPCSGHSDDYAIAYADKYCRRYESRASSFSSEGQQWIDGVRRCLQVALAPELSRNPSCKELKKEAFGSHAECYVRPAGAPSFCDLSLGDKKEVFKTIGDAFRSELFSSIGGTFQVGGKCTWREVKGAYNSVKGFLKKAWNRITDFFG